MKSRALCLAIAVSVVALAPAARGAVVERVVATVADRPILLSDVQRRAQPFVLRATRESGVPPTSAVNQIYRDVLGMLIDERLEQRAASTAGVSVSSSEVDRAIERIAGLARVTPATLVEEAGRQGLSEQDYRDEIGRQLLSGKLIELRVRGRVRVTEEDARTEYSRWLRDPSVEQRVEMRSLLLRIAADATAADIHARERLADRLATRARNGESFCKLVTIYSDGITKNCGSLGPTVPSVMLPEIRDLAVTLREGEIGGPVHPTHEAIVILQMAPPPGPPPYSEVREQMMARAMEDAFARARRQWLEEQRRSAFVDMRL